jgi:hypothetical protein
LQPACAEPWHEIGQLALLGGRVTAALDAFARAQACLPGHAPSAHAIRALFGGEPQREAEFWRPLCSARPEVRAFQHAYADALSRAGDTTRAAAPPAAVAAGRSPGV